MVVVIMFIKLVDFDTIACSMSKILIADKNSDMVNSVVSFDTEKNKVTGSQLLFGNHGAEQGLFTGGTRKEHSKVLFIKILHKS